MADALKHQLGPNIPVQIAQNIVAVYPAFAQQAFVQTVLQGYDELELLARGWKMAHTLRQFLPQDYEHALGILLASQGPVLSSTESFGMAPFIYLPYVYFVAEYGLEHFDASMQAQYELTQRFSAEFSIRAYLQRYPQATLQRLQQWINDPSPHVRRLVSEGTRPRLPWAPRLSAFQQDPTPVLALLEQLKDDPELYVRRSVANNLNDIGKDHPELLYQTAQRWLIDASPERQWLVKHALRSAIKRNEPGALAVLGYAEPAAVCIEHPSISPARIQLGQSISVQFTLYNPHPQPLALLVDLQVHFVKANGQTRAKTFKLKTLTLAPNSRTSLSKTISLAEMTTRQHYPGVHSVDVAINGKIEKLGSFCLDR